jgi:uncharacterized protein (DUF2336 family)
MTAASLAPPRRPPAARPRRRARALSGADVERLLADRGPEARIETMVKLVRDLESGDLSEAERRLAADVLERFAGDAEVAVREAVAWQICNSPLLTGRLAERLARDVARVAFPVLRHGEGLSDAFLLRLLAGGDPAAHLAVAGRRRVSPPVARAVAAHGNIAVVACLVRNRGARVDEGSLRHALDRFGRVRAVAEAVAARPGLPLAVVERLVSYASAGLRRALEREHGLSPELVSRLVARGREAATIELLRPLAAGPAESELLADWLEATGRLTPSLLFRALCAGDLDLFTAGLAQRAGVSASAARTVAWDDGPLGLPALFRRCLFPAQLVRPFRVAVATAKELRYAGGDAGREAYQAEVIARVFEACAPTDDWAVDDLLLQAFDRKSDAVLERAMGQAGLPFLPVREPSAG